MSVKHSEPQWRRIDNKILWEIWTTNEKGRRRPHKFDTEEEARAWKERQEAKQAGIEPGGRTEGPGPATSSWWATRARALANRLLDAVARDDPEAIKTADKACRAFASIAIASAKHTSQAELEVEFETLKREIGQTKRDRAQAVKKRGALKILPGPQRVSDEQSEASDEEKEPLPSSPTAAPRQCSSPR